MKSASTENVPWVTPRGAEVPSLEFWDLCSARRFLVFAIPIACALRNLFLPNRQPAKSGYIWSGLLRKLSDQIFPAFFTMISCVAFVPRLSSLLTALRWRRPTPVRLAETRLFEAAKRRYSAEKKKIGF